MNKLILTTVLLALTVTAQADITVPMYTTDNHQFIGNITFVNSEYGVIIEPDLKDLMPGMHGFHIHVNPSCDNKGLAAGGHWDLANTGKHLGPYDNYGHIGDLPALYVNSQGIANLPLIAPKLKFDEIKNHALMIHAGGDNYSDSPKPLGGGGARVACGVI